MTTMRLAMAASSQAPTSVVGDVGWQIASICQRLSIVLWPPTAPDRAGAGARIEARQGGPLKATLARRLTAAQAFWDLAWTGRTRGETYALASHSSGRAP